VKILAVKCTQVAVVFEKYGRELLPPPGNTASCHIPVEGLNCKRPIPICRLFFKIDLLTYIAALCFTDFIDWRYIHSLVGIFDPACELLPPWMKELNLCTVAPLSSL
jgi:hypothetical protein